MTPDELKKWRIDRKMTQRAAADFFCIKMRQYQNWESGDSDIPEHVPAMIDLAARVSS